MIIWNKVFRKNTCKCIFYNYVHSWWNAFFIITMQKYEQNVKYGMYVNTRLGVMKLFVLEWWNYSSWGDEITPFGLIKLPSCCDEVTNLGVMKLPVLWWWNYPSLGDEITRLGVMKLPVLGWWNYPSWGDEVTNLGVMKLPILGWWNYPPWGDEITRRGVMKLPVLGWLNYPF